MVRIARAVSGQEIRLDEAAPVHKMVCCKCGVIHGFNFVIYDGYIKLRIWEEKTCTKTKAGKSKQSAGRAKKR